MHQLLPCMPLSVQHRCFCLAQVLLDPSTAVLGSVVDVEVTSAGRWSVRGRVVARIIWPPAAQGPEPLCHGVARPADDAGGSAADAADDAGGSAADSASGGNEPLARNARPESARGKPESAGGKQESAGGESETTEGKQESTGGKQESAGGKPRSAGGKPVAAVSASLQGSEQAAGRHEDGGTGGVAEVDRHPACGRAELAAAAHEETAKVRDGACGDSCGCAVLVDASEGSAELEGRASTSAGSRSAPAPSSAAAAAAPGRSHLGRRRAGSVPAQGATDLDAGRQAVPRAAGVEHGTTGRQTDRRHGTGVPLQGEPLQAGVSARTTAAEQKPADVSTGSRGRVREVKGGITEALVGVDRLPSAASGTGWLQWLDRTADVVLRLGVIVGMSGVFVCGLLTLLRS
jgi:trimeric autotransporter adhesin